MRLNELIVRVTDLIFNYKFLVHIFQWNTEINVNGPTRIKEMVVSSLGQACTVLASQKDQSKLIWDANKTKVVGIEIALPAFFNDFF
jgi:hypothetical protein